MSTKCKRTIPSDVLHAEMQRQFLPFCPFTAELSADLLGTDDSERVGAKLGALVHAGYLNDYAYYFGGQLVVNLDESVMGDSGVTDDTVERMLSIIHDIVTDHGMFLYVVNTDDGWW